MQHIMTIENGKYPIILEQYERATQRFKVTYGLQIKRNLDYAAAAEEFGLCYFHMLACEGKFDHWSYDGNECSND